MPNRTPNPAAIRAFRRRKPALWKAPTRAGELLALLHRTNHHLEELEALAAKSPELLAPLSAEKCAGSLTGARRTLAKWIRALEEAQHRRHR
jgi:hypothetical protein